MADVYLELVAVVSVIMSKVFVAVQADSPDLPSMYQHTKIFEKE